VNKGFEILCGIEQSLGCEFKQSELFLMLNKLVVCQGGPLVSYLPLNKNAKNPKTINGAIIIAPSFLIMPVELDEETLGSRTVVGLE
tara:strand:+ start:744 stop:1004 length:261 start_codon:yes stop_codon:yes gene_type:complete